MIAGYDASDPLTAFGVGRLPDQPYETFTHETSLKGMRIGYNHYQREENAVRDREPTDGLRNFSCGNVLIGVWRIEQRVAGRGGDSRRCSFPRTGGVVASYRVVH